MDRARHSQTPRNYGKELPIKVGIITNIPAPYRLAMFSRFAARPGVELHVAFNALTERNRLWKREDEELGFTYTFLYGKSISVPGKDLLSIHINLGVRQWIDANDLDVVILAGWNQPSQIVALLHCRSKRIPLIFWSGSINGNDTALRRVSRLAMRFFIRSSSAFIAYGSDSADYLVGLGAPRSRVHRAFNTVDIDWWKMQALQADRTETRKNLGVDDTVTFLFVGQLVDRKGVHGLVDAICSMKVGGKEVRLVVAGTGPLDSALRNMVEQHENGSRIILLGHVPEANLAALYKACDVVVLPSTYEVWGLVLNEGMAIGRPVIATSSVGASRDLITHGENGWVIPAGSVDSLRAQLEAVASLDAGTLQEMGERARADVSNRFNLDVAAAAIEDAVQAAFGQQEASRRSLHSSAG